MLALAPGRYRVWALSSATRRFAERTVELREGMELEGIDLVLSARGTIAGRVLDPELQPLAGAWVLLFKKDARLEERSGPVDGEGRFRFEGLEEGLYSVSASYVESNSNGRLERPFARCQVRDLPVGREDLELVLGRNARLAGSVVDAQGERLVGAIVNAMDGGGEGYQARSDADGRFELQVPEESVLALEAAWSPSNGDARRLVGRKEGVQASQEVVLRLQ